MHEDNKKAVESHKWFHAIEFDDGVSSAGRFSASRPSNYTLYGALSYLEHMNTSNAQCMDIGTMDGLIAFTLENQKCRKIIATDIAARKSFLLAKDILGSNIEYSVPMNVLELHNSDSPEFDLIVFCGILYHVFDPLSALVAIRKNIKNGGYLLLETQYFYDEKKAVISYSPSDDDRGSIHANTFFRPSYTALVGMLETASFQVKSTISVDSRITILAQAMRPKEIEPSSQMLKNILLNYRKYPNYKESIDYEKLDSCKAEADISYSGPEGDFYIFSGQFRTSNRLQPQWRAGLLQKANEFIKNLSFYVKTCFSRKTLLSVWKSL